MIILAIDPGPEVSAFLYYERGKILDHGKIDNPTLLVSIANTLSEHLAIEMIASYGMGVGREVFETCVWIGRFVEAYRRNGERPWSYVYRREVKLHLCGTVRATDSNVRFALVDRYGGKTKALGVKAARGPLHGLKRDAWAALGIAITFDEKHDAHGNKRA